MTPYEALGGEAALRALVRAFYAHMDRLPEAAGVRALHLDMARAEQRLFEFLSGWLGGPQLFVERHGHPRLRARHLPFTIGLAEARGWMACMHAALAETVEDEALRDLLALRLAELANHMRNQPEAQGD